MELDRRAKPLNRIPPEGIDIAIGRGTIPFPSETKLQKQKQELSKKLIAAFGIKHDPIEVRDGCYVAQYVTNADGLKQGRKGAYQRNFVEDD